MTRSLPANQTIKSMGLLNYLDRTAPFHNEKGSKEFIEDIAAFRAGEKTKQQICKEWGIVRSTLDYWLKFEVSNNA